MQVEPGTDVHELAQLADGCSGAEIVSICQDAAIAAMNEYPYQPTRQGDQESDRMQDDGPEFVGKQHLIQAAKEARRGITPTMLQHFAKFKELSGLKSA